MNTRAPSRLQALRRTLETALATPRLEPISGPMTARLSACADADLPRLLSDLPVLTKADLRRGFPAAHVPRGFPLEAALADGRLELVTTSGTTEERVHVLWESGWWEAQERAAHGLNARLARFLERGYRECVLTTAQCSGTTCHLQPLSMEERTTLYGPALPDTGILFLNDRGAPASWREDDVDRFLDEIARFAPRGLEASPSYLVALLRLAKSRGRRLPDLLYVSLTYELVTEADRATIQEALPGAAIIEVFGLTEAGVLFVECEAGRLHENAAHHFVEALPLPGDPGVVRLFTTTLTKDVMPLVRYDTGDLGIIAEGPCPCGRAVGGAAGLLLRSIEGRARDVIERLDGSIVTPRAVDRAIGAASGIARYRVEQPARGVAELVIESSLPEAAALAGAADRLRALLGPGARVTARTAGRLPFEASGKNRSVVSHRSQERARQ